MLLLVTENPRGGLHLISPDGNEDIGSREVASLDLSLTKITATGVNPDFVCGVKAMFFSLTLYGVLMLMGKLYLFQSRNWFLRHLYLLIGLIMYFRTAGFGWWMERL